MAIIPLKAWYLAHYEPIREVIKRPYDLRLNRNSLLKSALRADILDDKQTIQESVWFKRYLEGDRVEFYVEGSGGYVISNIDLMSQEVYFSKQEINAILEPIIFFSGQTEYPSATETIKTVLTEALEKYNQRSRFPLSLEIAPRPQDSPLRLSDSQLRKVRKSLLFIADGTPITSIEQNQKSRLILSSSVCTELGYALPYKQIGQILLINLERSDVSGTWPFDLPQHQQLGFKNEEQLRQILPPVLETLLHRFNLTT
ncbi:hypothetical protein [Aphanothece sacrum]|uniref:Uncharacterized protein n=1 Tax=Aphanothece sacrum FPU1 TaxID=1920663 RepID=A0A401IKB2_APHSA|nr:hypothetical protein [Aphanothece sacrum]GBF81733.1 hypothetical protein AsFPU1_3153 [Aphanothece sacrum FPU1]GBF85091.1 hypothetical protein AsFPU3_2148 [Aphanothece sacrum FPU3]